MCGAVVKPGRGVCALGLVRLAAVFEAVALTVHFEDAGIDPSVGSVGGPYDNALAETLNGLYKAEVIHRLEPWKTLAAVAWETLKWVDWFNNCRLLAPIGYIPPSEAEERYYAQFNTLDMVA